MFNLVFLRNNLTENRGNEHKNVNQNKDTAKTIV